MMLCDLQFEKLKKKKKGGVGQEIIPTHKAVNPGLQMEGA